MDILRRGPGPNFPKIFFEVNLRGIHGYFNLIWALHYTFSAKLKVTVNETKQGTKFRLKLLDWISTSNSNGADCAPNT